MLKNQSASTVDQILDVLWQLPEVEGFTLTINDANGDSHRSVPITQDAAETLLKDQIWDMKNETYKKVGVEIAPIHVELGKQRDGRDINTHLTITI